MNLTILFGSTTADIGTELGSFFAIQDVGTVISGTLGAALLLGGLGFALYFVLSGVQWMTAGGDKTKIESARNRMTNAFIGLVLIAASYAVYNIVVYILALPVNVDGSASSGGTIPGTGDCQCSCSSGWANTGQIGALNPNCYECTDSGWDEREDLTYPDDCPPITCREECED